MPAKNIQRIDGEGVYSHVYNRGVASTIVFIDEQDYEVFQGFLKDYLTSQANPENIKKTFTVKGRTFRGIPHQPKNYFNKVELLAYSLMPNHFHLLLYQITKGSVQKFIRSLCTRYSMYFNKRHQRTGALFESPYKSAQITSVPLLLHMTRYLHHGPKENGKDLNNNHSSYGEYLGERETPWVKPKVVLSFLDKLENDSFKGACGYRNFVEKYGLNQEEMKLLEKIILENESGHLEGRAPILAGKELSEDPHLDPDLKPHSRITQFTMAAVVFMMLLGLGIRNIWASSTKTQSPIPSPIPAVSGAEDTVEEVKPKRILVIKIEDRSPSVNIRQNPTSHSEKIGEAKEGDTFEFVSKVSGWYEVKLADGSTGFISTKYLEIIEETNK